MASETKYSEHHKGWLAFRNGKALQSIERRIRVFRTEAAAWKALKKSKAFGAF